MATELEVANREATQRIWEIIESGNLEDLREVLHDDVVLRVPGKEEMQGIEAYTEYIETFGGAFPDTTFEVHDLFVDGETVITHFTWRGTHEAEFEGIEPTGESVAVTGMTINRFQDGKAVEDINIWDNLSFYEQLGLMESPG